MENQTHPKNHWLAAFGIVAALMIVFVYTGLKGVDYGMHWDEPAHLIQLNYAMSRGTLFLTDNYTYPGVLYDIQFLALLPDAADALAYADIQRTSFMQQQGITDQQIVHLRERYINAGYGRMDEREKEMYPRLSLVPWFADYYRNNVIFQPAFLIRVRTILIYVISLTILWIALAAKMLKRPPVVLRSGLLAMYFAPGATSRRL